MRNRVELGAFGDVVDCVEETGGESLSVSGRGVTKVEVKKTGVRKLARHLKYLIPQVRLALIREPRTKAPFVHSPEDIEKFVEPLKYYSEEHFVAFHLNAKHEVTGYQIVSHGSVSASLVHPREVFKAAILSNSYAILVAHNHPAGSLSPSKEDIETTEQLIKAGNLLGISVVDHVVVAASGGVYSIRENMPRLWTKDKFGI